MPDAVPIKTTITELLASLGRCEVTEVRERPTDQGTILDVHVQPMEHADVLCLTIELPEQVRNKYDLRIGFSMDPLKRHLQTREQDN